MTLFYKDSFLCNVFLTIRDLKIPWTRRLRERRRPGARTPPPSREKQIKIEQVGLSARLTRGDKVMLSCFNSITREVLLDWYLNDLLLEKKFVLPAMTPVSLKKKKKNEFLRGKLEGMIGFQVILGYLSYLLPDFFAFRCSRSCFKTIWFCYENFPY